jgi:nicotinamidase-related amidase
MQMRSNDAREAFSRLVTNPAIVTIDLHRGHLDPEVATLPLPADRSAALVKRCRGFLDAARELDVPIVHVITAYRDRAEILSNPYWAFQAQRPGSKRSNIAEHNLEGLPGLEMMPQLVADDDVYVTTKKRYDCFIGTDLEFILRSGGHDGLIVLGVNTNSCVLATAVAAAVRDFAVFVLDEGVDSMMGAELDDAARRVLDASFGWLIGAEDTLEALRAVGAGAATEGRPRGARPRTGARRRRAGTGRSARRSARRARRSSRRAAACGPRDHAPRGRRTGSSPPWSGPGRRSAPTRPSGRRAPGPRRRPAPGRPCAATGRSGARAPCCTRARRPPARACRGRPRRAGAAWSCRVPAARSGTARSSPRASARRCSARGRRRGS